jgi:sugar phosphate isomerase/epimerase
MIEATSLHSVSYSGSWGQAFLNLEEFVDRAADLGYDGVMLMAKRPHLSVLDYDERACSRLRLHMERRHVRAVCIAGYTNFTADLEHGEVPHREIQIQHVTELARIAAQLGCGLVRVFTGYETGAAPQAAQWKIVADSLAECARRAAGFGVTIGVQNHHDIAVGYEAFHDLIRAIDEPNCKALFDAWAPALHGADLNAAARLLAARTVHTTIANYQFRPRYRYDAALVNYVEQKPAVQAVPIDEGFIDYKSFLQSMGDNGFRGSVAYEMCSPLLGGGAIENLDRYARKFVEYIGELKAAPAPVAARV